MLGWLVACLSAMAHALLPNFSRLSLRTGARDSVREEIMAERFAAEAARLLAEPNRTIERAIAMVRSRDLETLRGAADAAQQYKSAMMGALRIQTRALLSTAVWEASVRRYAAFLQQALEELEYLSTELQAAMYDGSDEAMNEAIDVQPYQAKREVLEAILTADDDTPWKLYGAKVPLGREGHEAYKAQLKTVIGDIDRTINILTTRPDTAQDRQLWRSDLLEVMRQAASTRIIGEVDVARALVDRRREREGGARPGGRSDAYRAHYDMPIPELAPHMQLIFDLIMKEVDDMKDMILRNGMGPGQDVRETVDFGAFGLGRATIQVTAARSAYFIRWFLGNNAQASPIQRLIGSETKYVSNAASSRPDLKRWLNYLDKEVLSDRARRSAARTWTRNPPSITPRVVGSV